MLMVVNFRNGLESIGVIVCGKDVTCSFFCMIVVTYRNGDIVLNCETELKII